MTEMVAANPEIITWARKKSGYLDIDEVKHKFKKIEEWESGTSSPTYCQLESLSESFKIPVAVFFFPSPPDIPDIEKTFRTLPGVEFEKIPSKVRQLLNKAKAFQLNLAELCHRKNPSEKLITDSLSFVADVSVVEMASRAREFIGVTLEEQKSWNDADDALKKWRDALFAKGIFVFKDKFMVEDYCGFCLYDKVFPIIYVNNSTSKTRQIFTLFHELAHLLFRTSGIDSENGFSHNLTGDAKKIEILCNKFAAEFLFPQKHFAEVVRGNSFNSLSAIDEIVETLANEYHVSRESVLRKFLDRKTISKKSYIELVKKYNSQMKGKDIKGGGNYYLSALAYLGKDYINLAFSQYYKNIITYDELADYLNIKPKAVERLEEVYERSLT